MHWAQFFATCAAFAAVAGTAGAIYFPARARRDVRVAARHAERDRTLQATISTAVTAQTNALKADLVTQTSAIKTDMIARVDESDRRIDQRLSAVAESVEKLRTKAEATDLRFAREFGGNGNGIRQTVNETAQHIANLAGRFEQHLAETGNR